MTAGKRAVGRKCSGCGCVQKGVWKKGVGHRLFVPPLPHHPARHAHTQRREKGGKTLMIENCADRRTDGVGGKRDRHTQVDGVERREGARTGRALGTGRPRPCPLALTAIHRKLAGLLAGWGRAQRRLLRAQGVGATAAGDAVTTGAVGSTGCAQGVAPTAVVVGVMGWGGRGAHLYCTGYSGA